MTDYLPSNWYWIVGGDETQVFASARGALVPVTDTAYTAWLAAGNAPTRIDSMASLVDVLRAAGVPPYHKVRTYTVVLRLTSAGVIEAADAALEGNRDLWRQFYTAGSIDADNAAARDFLTGIGADPSVILAPE